ncbi:MULTISPECIES: glycogen debranching N-terminal domain-containing protein [unclassified Rathayibacter]|uniref:glycogen debranching N-terminal domain-containing protein n=1 Tax=unclassified Rathayibacter TaxID=2609250 RepID=UPI000CE8408B|nr:MULTISPECIES: glycogen debranching N-terminal domain-containing protein [unclassified Rathayibacter]PPF26744.1 amylo-alpha-1,6-glucosidase [Rathayibacter sp. AY1F2]PPH45474.1 amylo-alpha-1,6-glucosidase [Rathayibacter sp. AY1F7]
MTTERDDRQTPPRQPLLHDSLVLLLAPVQLWSDEAGEVGSRPVHGLYLGDVRVLAGASLRVGGAALEAIATGRDGASSARFTALARHLDDAAADPRIRVVRSREVSAGGVRESIRLESALPDEVATTVELTLDPDFSLVHVVKAGLRDEPSFATALVDGGLDWTHGPVRAELRAPGASISGTVLTWSVVVPARGSVEVVWSVAAEDASAVVAAASGPAEWAGTALETGDSRLASWCRAALDDLDALRMVTVERPGEPFLAAGAPWFFTLFGRDSIWAARMLLPLGTGIAASTLRVLAGLQGTRHVADTAEQPGRIMHELRATTLEIPGEGVSLPPLYFGTVDATALWVCLLHDAWRWGLPDDEVEELLPALEAALRWLRDDGDSDGDGFLEYVDTTGHGLANQGWKDSGDSIQWRDGTLAEGPIALCEVQAYAHEAMVGGAALLEHLGRDGSEWREAASTLKARFAEAFWIDDADGGYPAIALDAAGRPVDTITSNLGHLLGTGILSPEHAARVAELLVSSGLDSGFGLRTLDTGSGGYWPLSYHGGSVWAHDTAIAVTGLAREGFGAEATTLSRGLIAAAEGFGYRMPELHSGDPAAEVHAPVPYPAACRPQAWSAAASVAVLSAALGLAPGGDTLVVAPLSPALAGPIRVDGIRYRGSVVPVDWDGKI